MTEISIAADTGKAILQQLHHPEFDRTKIQATVLRLDLIHPVVSGNKWFKLKYPVREALAQKKKGIVSFGGAYSNHLTALAYACRQSGLQSSGIIRGDETLTDNESIRQMKEYGMELIFASRDEYKYKNELLDKYLSRHSGYYYVPEGGQSVQGIAGAEEILGLLPENGYSHIACSVGTGTTLAGIINSSRPEQQVMGISSLKISDTSNGLLQWLGENTRQGNYQLYYDYHFGGYARKNNKLTGFMNDIYHRYRIPTDFVYTAKMFYAVFDLLRKDHFKSGDHILMIHTGGLQGNRSLPAGTLNF